MSAEYFQSLSVENEEPNRLSPDNSVAPNRLTGQVEETATSVLDDDFASVFSRGMDAGARGLDADIQYFKALGNTMLGDEEAAVDNVAAARVREEMAGMSLEGLENFGEFLEEPTFGGFLTQVAKSTGQLMPSVVSSFAGAGIGGIAAAVGKGVVTKAGRHAAQRIVTDSIKRVAAGTATPDEQILADSFYGYTRSAITKGALVGAGASEYAPLAGSNLSEALDSGEELDRGTALRAATVAAPQAAIGVASEAYLLRMIGKIAKTRGSDGGTFANLANGIGRGFAEQGTVEGLTEVAQEGISVANRMDLDDSYTAEEAQLRIAEAAFGGLFGGGAIGAAGGAAGATYNSFGNVMLEAERRLKDGQQQKTDEQINDEQYGLGETAPNATTAESQADINAQMRALFDDSSRKDSMWIAGDESAGMFGADGKRRNKETGKFYHTAYIPGRGTIISRYKSVVDEVVAGEGSDSVVGAALGYATKEKPTNGMVVRSLDKDGNVVSEEIADLDSMEAAIDAAEGFAPEGGRIDVMTVEQAMEARRAKYEAERNPLAEDDMVFDDEDDPYYENDDGEALAGGQVEESLYEDGADRTEAAGETILRDQVYKPRSGKYDGQDLRDTEAKFREVFPNDENYKQYSRALMAAAIREAQSPSVQVEVRKQPEGDFQLAVTNFDELYQIDHDGKSERVTLPVFVKKAVSKASQTKEKWRNVQITRPDGSTVGGGASLHDLVNSGRRLLQQRDGTTFQGGGIEATRAALSEILGDLTLEGYTVSDAEGNVISSPDDVGKAYDSAGRFTGSGDLNAFHQQSLQYLSRSGGGLRDPGVNRETDTDLLLQEMSLQELDEEARRLEDVIDDPSVDVRQEPTTSAATRQFDQTERDEAVNRLYRVQKLIEERETGETQRASELPVQQQTSADIDPYFQGSRAPRDKRKTPLRTNRLENDTFDANQKKAAIERKAGQKAKWATLKKKRVEQQKVLSGVQDPESTLQEQVNVQPLDENKNIQPQEQAQPQQQKKGTRTLGEAVQLQYPSGTRRRSFKTNKMFQDIKEQLAETYADLNEYTIVSLSEASAMTWPQMEAAYGKEVATAVFTSLNNTLQTKGEVKVGGRHIRDARVILINETGSTTMDAMVLAHELGHAVMRIEQEKSLLKPAMVKRLKAAFEKDPLFKEYYEPELGYDVGFDEWYADQVSLWATKKYLNRRAKNMSESHFKDVVRKLRNIWRKTKSALLKKRLDFDRPVDTTFESYMESITSRAKMKDTINSTFDSVMPQQLREYLKEQGGEKLGRFYNRKILGDMVGVFNSIFFTADARLRKLAGDEVADFFYVRSQAGDGRLGYLRQRNVVMNEWKNRFESEIGSINDEDVQAAMTLAVDDDIATTDMEAGSKERAIREFLDSFFTDYVDPSNTNVRRQANYFPVVLNLMEVSENSNAFADLIRNADPAWNDKKEKALKKAMNNIHKYQQAVQGEGVAEIDPLDPSARAEAQRILTANVPRKALLDAGFLMDPSLSFIEYMGHMTKRVEFNRATGGSTNLQAKLEKLSAADRETANQIISTYMGYQKDPIQPWLRKVNSYGQFLQFITILPFATIASLPDLAGPIINAKEIGALSMGFKAFAATVKNRQEAIELSRDLGLVTSETIANAWTSQAEQDFMDPAVRGASDKFFQLIGLDFFTRFTREFASNMGIMFMARHTERAAAGDPTSQRYMDELGITAKQFQEWAAGGGTFDTDSGKAVKAGLQRFVESSIMRPNAAERPVWASDPRFALIWQLKSYFYAFYKTIMQGAWREMKARTEGLTGAEQGTAVASLMILSGAALMPLAMLGNELREYGKYGLAWLLPGAEPKATYFRSDRQDWSEYMPEMFEKAGLLGPMAIPGMMFQSAEWGDSPLISLFGPTAETVDEALTNGWDIGKTVKDRLLPGYTIL